MFGQTFDFDLGVWACTEKPLDENAKVAATRINNCLSDTYTKHWDKIADKITYGDRAGSFGWVTFNQPVETGLITGVKEFGFHRQTLYERCRGCLDGEATVWHEFARTHLEEVIHVDDHYEVGYERWENAGFQERMSRAKFTTFDYHNYELFSIQRSLDAFRSEFGVHSPADERYNPDLHRQFTCSLYD